MAELDLTIRPLSEDVSANDTIDLRGEVCPTRSSSPSWPWRTWRWVTCWVSCWTTCPRWTTARAASRMRGQEILGVEQQDENDWVVTVRKVHD